MERSRWTMTLLLALGLAPLARAQTLPATVPPDRLVILQEEGKPPRQGVIEQTYREPDGSLTHRVRMVETGEVLSIQDNRPDVTLPPPKTGTRLTRWFHSAPPAAPPHAAPTAAIVAVVPGGAAVPAPTAPANPIRPVSVTGPVLNPPVALAAVAGRPAVAPAALAAGTAKPAAGETRLMRPPGRSATGGGTGTVPTAEGGYVAHWARRLREATGPSEREQAALVLAASPWRTNPEVSTALLTAARQDPAASVRACCVRCVSSLRVQSPTCTATLRALERDPDAHVRAEVRQAMGVLANP